MTERRAANAEVPGRPSKDEVLPPLRVELSGLYMFEVWAQPLAASQPPLTDEEEARAR